MRVLTVSVQPLALRMGTNSPEYLTAYYLLLQVRDTRDDVFNGRLTTMKALLETGIDFSLKDNGTT